MYYVARSGNKYNRNSRPPLCGKKVVSDGEAA